MVRGLFGTMFNVSRGVLEARSISLSFFIPTTSLEAIFLAIGKPFLQQELPTIINQSSSGHVIRQGRNRFDADEWSTKCCSDPTTARDRAMLDPCELSAYTRVSLRRNSTYVHFRKPRGSQRWIQDNGCLPLIR